MTRKNHRRALGVAAVGALVGSGMVAVPAFSAPPTGEPSERQCQTRANKTFTNFLECVTVDGTMEHLEAFQQIADENGGNRASLTPGYEASVDYVVEKLEASNWDVEVVPFTYAAADTALEQLTPVQAEYQHVDATGTGEGDVTAEVVPVDINLDGDRANSSGCEDSDFANFPNGAIALVQRGTCAFAIKAENAEANGASAVIIFNQGDSIGAGDRFGLLNPTLGEFQAAVPVVGTTFAAGEALAQEGSTARVLVNYYDAEDYNVIAEMEGRNEDNVVMAGAHLDGVPVGPGINDNGSGSAALLEVAENMRKTKPANTVRLAWWGAEELGLIGSTEWVNQRTQEELDEIALYLNFDMVGSPNYYFGIYDANESSFVAEAPVPEGSEDLERTFEEYYTLLGEPYDDSAFSGRSDYQAFINNGIPSSGLFTGAEVVKTEEQQAIWGGVAGESFDQCYHQACDDIDNVDRHALEVNTDVMAYAVFKYAASTESVNGVRGRTVPGKFEVPEPAGPEHTFAGPLGGDAPEDHDHDAATE